MKDARSLPGGERWAITEKGSYDLRCAETCTCDPKLAGLLLTCGECGTVYGSVRNSYPFGAGSRKRD